VTFTTENARNDALCLRLQELLTVKEFAYLANLHPESVRRRIRLGCQPGAVRLGGQWRIDVAVAVDLSAKTST